MRSAPLILCLAAAGLMQAGEPQPAAPPTPELQPIVQPNAAQRKVAYLGVFTSIATPTVREQLGLPGGVGVAVEAVDAGSPAQRAGVQPHDIITKLDDQLVINVHQFGVLVQLRKAGESVNLTVVRHGKPMPISVQLGERALTPADDAGVITAGPPHGSGRITSIVQQTDGAHMITLTTHGDADRHVRIADTKGQLLFEGPLNTPDDRARVPADCRAKVETMEKNWEWYKQLRNSAPKTSAVPLPTPPSGN